MSTNEPEVPDMHALIEVLAALLARTCTTPAATLEIPPRPPCEKAA